MCSKRKVCAGQWGTDSELNQRLSLIKVKNVLLSEESLPGGTERDKTTNNNFILGRDAAGLPISL